MRGKMQLLSFSGRFIVGLSLTACLLVAGGGWWQCQRSDAIAFLPARAGAEWIVESRPPQIEAHMAHPAGTIFHRVFNLNSQPASARLSLCAFKTAGVRVNGHEVAGLNCTGKNWKLPVSTDIARWLQAGTNDLTVCVTNRTGPPALWLRLQAAETSLGSDASWQASPAGGIWHAARAATEPAGIPVWSPLYDSLRMSDSLRRVWPLLVLFGAASLALIWGVSWWLRAQPPVLRSCGSEGGSTLPSSVAEALRRVDNPPVLRSRATAEGGQPSARLMNVLLAVIILARAALFLHDQPRLPTWMGFDAPAHQAYIKFIEDHDGALPLPNDGFEMHQPPLYYVGCSAWLNALGLSAGDAAAVLPLRAVNGVLGLLHCWLVCLCLRRLFPKNLAAQAVGLLVAAFLPVHLYLSMYVTNDPLAGLLVTAAFYLFLRLLQSEPGHVWLHAGIGLALGAALLTKLTTAPVVPVFLLALALWLVAQKKTSARDWLQGPGVVALVCVATSGWHYARVWRQIGSLPLPNSQTGLAGAWWQDPGFRAGGFYWHFGQALVWPWCSGFNSFADGIYTTLWGDGQISGMSQVLSRPPWNYDLMNAGYLLSLAPTVLLLLGLAVVIRRCLRRLETDWFLVSGLMLVCLLGLVFATLQAPYLASVKAFYASPALLSFSALIAAGWNWLAQKGRLGRTLLWTVVLVWAMTAYAACWIDGRKAETWRFQAIWQLHEQHSGEGVASITRALQLQPDDAASHCILGELLLQQDRRTEAIQQYEEALRLRPDYPDMLNDFAALLASGGAEEAARAVNLAERACELTSYRQSRLVSTLAAAYAGSGQGGSALTAAQFAANLATQNGETGLIQANQELLKSCRAKWATNQERLAALAVELKAHPTVAGHAEAAALCAWQENFSATLEHYSVAQRLEPESPQCLNNQAWLLAACPRLEFRDGPRAVILAQQACELTKYGMAACIGTLAAAQAQAGKFDDAVLTAQRACAVAAQAGETNLVRRNQELLELYRVHKAVPEQPMPMSREHSPDILP